MFNKAKRIKQLEGKLEKLKLSITKLCDHKDFKVVEEDVFYLKCNTCQYIVKITEKEYYIKFEQLLQIKLNNFIQNKGNKT